MNSWFTVKVKYTKQLENGSLKRVNEPYLLAAMTFTDAEARIYEELSAMIRGEFMVTGITRTDLQDIFQYEDSANWFKCKITYGVDEEDGEKKKKVAQNFLVSAPDVKEAYLRMEESLATLMIVAKSDQAFHGLKDAFRNRTVSKIYHALVQGHMDPSTGTIDAPIDRHPKEDHRFAVVATGKESITHYEVMEFYRAVSMVKIELETGRTHQIRVHFSALHHPLVGDTTYGADPVLGKSLGMSRPWLHAAELSFSHPVTQAKLNFKAPYPSDLTGSLALLSDAVLP